MNYIKFNEYGQRSGMEVTNIVKLSDSADKIYIFYDLDISTEESAYRCFARIKRADGHKVADTILTLTVFAFDTEAEAEEYGTQTYNEITLKYDVPCRELTMTEEMLGADGDLQITIVYQEVDELGSVIATKVNSMSVIPVYDSVQPEYDDASTLEILETFMLRDLSDITDSAQPTVSDKILVRQGGATKLITVGQLNDLLETGITVFKKVAYDTIAPAETISIGETRWNADAETLETRVSNDVYLQHGQELAFKCKNTSGKDISNGTPVYITGASGSSANFYIAKADSSNYIKTSRFVGLAIEDIDAGAWGKVCVIGIVNGLNTNTFEVGDVVYLGAGGIITTVRPTTNVLALGVVIQKSTTQGRIALRPIFFPRLEDLSTVHYSALANGDILVKDATGWKNYALSNKANVSDLTAGTITVKKAENDKDGNAIGTTYVKVSGVNAMTGNLNLGTNKIINLVDGVGNQDGATIKNIDTKITAHDGSGTAHLYIRELIAALEQEIERLDGRGKSYGEIAYTTAQLLALTQEILDDTITDAVALGHGGEQYIPSNGDLVYDLGVGAGVAYHEWEFNGTNWVDNGLIGYSKASNTIHGMIKGDGIYLSVVSGIVEVLKSNYADEIGTSGGSYTYAQLLSALSDRYTKAEVDALLDALKTAFGWEETDLGDYTAPVDLSGYDLVIADLSETSDFLHNTQIFNPSDYAVGDTVVLSIVEPSDDALVENGILLKGASTWSYQRVTGLTSILKLRGYKIAPIIDENVEGDYTGSNYIADETNVHDAIVELDDTLHDAWVEIGEIEDGTVAVAVAGKATNDANDNQIDLTYEKIANKTTTWQETPDDTHYPSEKLVDDRIAPIEANVDVLQLDNATKSKQILDIEETLRKSMSGEVTGTASGTDIITLGKDVANAPLKVNVEGGLLCAPNQLTATSTAQDGITITVSGNQITLSGTASADTDIVLTNLLTIGNKAYVNYDYVSGTFTGTFALKNDTSLHATYNTDYSGVITVAHANVIISIASGSVATSLIIKINIEKATVLITNKQYSPLYATTFDLMTDEQIKAQMDLWVNNGTLPNANLLATSFDKRIRSVGKNSVDVFNTELTVGNIATNGTLTDTAVSMIISKVGQSIITTSPSLGAGWITDFIPVKSSTSYIYQIIGSGSQFITIGLYDVNKVFIERLTTASMILSSTVKYIKINQRFNAGTFENTFQLELGSTATTYEAYVHNDLYIQGNSLGYRLPNSVKDEELQLDGKMYQVKRINTVAVVGVVAVNTTNYPLAKNGGQFINYLTAGGSEIGVIGTNSTSGDGFMLYELDTPIETEILALGNIQGQPNGTVYVENATQDADIYATSATISNTALPISSLSELVKIGSDGLQTRLAVATAVVAGDGLSFTHSGLTAGDIVWFSYSHEGDYFSSTTTITYYDNNNVLVSPDGSAWKETRTIDNSGVITSLWVKV